MRVALLAGAIGAASAASGVDISQPIDLGTAQCMVQNGMTFGIVRGWCSYGGFDSNVVGSIANMWSAGFAHVDSYMFPCAGQDATAQVNSFVSQLSSNGVQYGMIWFDVETNTSDGCGWSDPADNCNYMQALVNAANANGVNYGIYASAYMWSSIMGDGCTVGGSNPLWYAHYDGDAGFDDFSPFGGWSTPAMKQYSGTNTFCGFGIDNDWYPDSVAHPAMNATKPSMIKQKVALRASTK